MKTPDEKRLSGWVVLIPAVLIVGLTAWFIVAYAG